MTGAIRPHNPPLRALTCRARRAVRSSFHLENTLYGKSVTALVKIFTCPGRWTYSPPTHLSTFLSVYVGGGVPVPPSVHTLTLWLSLSGVLAEISIDLCFTATSRARNGSSNYCQTVISTVWVSGVFENHHLASFCQSLPHFPLRNAHQRPSLSLSSLPQSVCAVSDVASVLCIHELHDTSKVRAIRGRSIIRETLAACTCR